MSSEYQNVEVKERITERLNAALIDSGKLSQAITKSSKTREVLQQTTKHFALLDNNISNTYQNLHLLQKTTERLSDQAVAMEVGLIFELCKPAVSSIPQIRLFSGKVIDVVVSSLRLDRILATGLATGRNKIEFSLLSGCVKLNGKTVTDKSIEVKKGDIIDRISPENSTETNYVLGRVQLQEIGEKTSKGNLRVRLIRAKYLVIEKLKYQDSIKEIDSHG